MAYAFGSFAGSTFPIKIVSYQAGAFVDVTNDFPSRIKADAAHHWHEYLTDADSGISPQSALVSYLADEYRLHNVTAAWSRVIASYGVVPAFQAHANVWLKQNHYATKNASEPNPTYTNI